MSREATLRARVLVALTHEPQTLADLGECTKLGWFTVSTVAKGLMREELCFPDQTVPPTVALTTAPHVQRAQEEARKLLAGRGSGGGT